MSRELTSTEKLFLSLDSDIRDRKGIGNEWEQISGKVMMNEIKPAWEKIINVSISESYAAGWFAGRDAAAVVCRERGAAQRFLSKRNELYWCADVIAVLTPTDSVIKEIKND